MNDYNDESLAPVAGAIREKFMELKEEQLGKAPRNSSRDKPSNWQKAAKLCLDLKAEPDEFVRSCFDFWPISRGPFPHTLGGKAARLCYSQFISNAKAKNVDVDTKNITAATRMQDLVHDLNAARKAMVRLNGTPKPIDANLDWLCAKHTKLKPHVRVLLAYPDGRVKAICGEEAYQEFAQSQALRNAVTELGYPLDEILNWL